MAKSAVKAKVKAEPVDLPALTSASGAFLLPIGDLTPYENNARKHAPAETHELAEKIDVYGYTNPILIDRSAKNLINAGHGRRLAVLHLYSLGKRLHYPNGELIPEGMVPCIDCSGWDEAKRAAYVIWDNQSSTKSSWDFDLMAKELLRIQDLDPSALQLTGLSASELDNMLKLDALPSLEELEQKHGAHDEAAFWPEIRIQVPPETQTLYNTLMQAGDKTSPEWVRFQAMLEKVPVL